MRGHRLRRVLVRYELQCARHRLLLLAQQIRGSGSPTSWSITRLPAERRLHQHHPRRLRPHLADLRRLLAARHGAQRGERRVRRARARRTRPACPRWPRTSGRSRGSRPRPRRRAHRHVGLADDDRHAGRARELVEHRRDAAAGRVAQAAQRRSPAASSSASTAGHSEQVSDSIVGVELELAAREHDRGAVLADRAGDDDPVARAAAPRATAAARGSRRPMPVVQMYIPSAVAALDDLGVAGDDLDAGRARGARRSPRPRRAASSAASPSSRTSESVSASGRAPAIARSLTVPLTASSPIEPPGKRSGLTTKLSVVIASSCRRRDRAGVAELAPAASLPNAGTSSPSISVCVALPPAPWAIVICSSRNFGRLARAVSMIPRTFCACARRRRRRGPLTPPPARARSGRSCSRRRRRPRARPCRCRSARSGVQAVPNTLHSHGLMTPLSTSPHWHALGSATRTPGTRPAQLGVEVGVGVGELQRALGDEPEAAPLEVRPQLEDLGHHLERAQVALVGDDALVLVLDLAAALGAAGCRIIRIDCRMSSGSKPEIDDRLAVVGAG